MHLQRVPSGVLTTTVLSPHTARGLLRGKPTQMEENLIFFLLIPSGRKASASSPGCHINTLCWT